MAPRRTILRTSRLVLRPYAVHDAEPLAAAIGTYDVARWLGRIPYPYGVDDARAFIAKARHRAGRDWLIERDGTLVGGISVDHELGYWFARAAWGRGLATEACDAAVDAFFADRSAHVLTSGHLVDNTRSAQVLDKQGFHYTGSVREVQSAALSQTIVSRAMVLTRETWRARRQYRLSTPHLMIRELRPSDLAAVLRIGDQPDTVAMFGDDGAPLTEIAARTWLDRARYRGRPGFALAVCRWRRVIGLIQLRRVQGPTRDDRGECRITMDPRHLAHADEALQAFLRDVTARGALASVSAIPAAP